ncbi:hypothetical protein C8R47DRAFT_1103551 [Mycena vitilis]|nr:hypothetical protein C8R47DRAFT_1103551 [Mycena vitilis]
MKLSTSFLLLATQLSGILAAVSISNAAAECGELGVMNVSAIDLAAAGITADEVRKCEGHPEGNSLTMAQPSGNNLTLIIKPGEDACVYNSAGGCSANGYCWKTCGQPGDGKWCWIATKGGYGGWQTCKKYTDCGGITTGCGAGCLTTNFCGCSC